MPYLSRLWVFFLFFLSLPYILVVLLLQAALKPLFPKQIRTVGQKTLGLLARYLFVGCGIKVTVIGRENMPAEGCVLVSNHQSMMDIMLLYGYLGRPMGMVAKQELSKVPIVSQWMRDMDCYLLARDNPAQAAGLFAKAASDVRSGYTALIYPEGKRSKGPNVDEFFLGAFKLPLMAKSKVVPITINGGWKFMYKRPHAFSRDPIEIIIHPAIDSTEYGKVRQKELSDTVRDAIVSGFNSGNL